MHFPAEFQFLSSFSILLHFSQFSEGKETCGSSSLSPNPSNWIVDGEVTSSAAFPWMVSVQTHLFGSDSHLCGGAVISDRWILTAAHCFSYSTSEDLYRILVGSDTLEGKKGTKLKIDKILIHPKYSTIGVKRNDFALLKTSTPIVFSPQVGAVCLPGGDGSGVDDVSGVASSSSKTGAVVGASPSGVLAFISGWGETTPRAPGEGSTGEKAPVLRAAPVLVWDPEKCAAPEVYGGDFDAAAMICAGWERGGADSCVGDSGGPLVIEVEGGWTVLGVTSFGRGCGQKMSPGVYASVPSAIAWIERIIKS